MDLSELKPANLTVAESKATWSAKLGRFAELPQWEPSMIRSIDFPTILLVGKRRTGKSFWARWFLYYMRDMYPYGIIVTETKFNGFWQKVFPEGFIHEEYDEGLMGRLLKRQRELYGLVQDGKLAPEYMNIFVVMDDIMGSSESLLRFGTALRKLFTQGRHFHVMLLICVQDMMALPPKARNNIDLVVVMKQEQRRNIEAIRDNWLSFLTYPEAEQLIHMNTTVDKRGAKVLRKNCLIIDSGNDYDKSGENLFTCYAKDPGPFKLGCKRFWKLASEDKEPTDGEPAAKRAAQLSVSFTEERKPLTYSEVVDQYRYGR